jgi:hypothetical protein
LKVLRFAAHRITGRLYPDNKFHAYKGYRQPSGATTMKYRWRANSKYQLSLNDGAFTDIYGDKNKKFYKPFTVDKPENYSSLP